MLIHTSCTKIGQVIITQTTHISFTVKTLKKEMIAYRISDMDVTTYATTNRTQRLYHITLLALGCNNVKHISDQFFAF